VQALGFDVISDLEADELADVLNDLAEFEVWAADYLPGKPARARVPMRMLIFSSNAGFRDLFGTQNFAGFLQPSISSSTLAIAPHRGDRDLLETARHEYSHYLLRNRLDVSLPTWFDEGLASLLSNVVIRDDHVLLGRLPKQTMLTLTHDGAVLRISLKETLETDYLLDWSRVEISQFYDWSWLLTHYLMLSSSKRRESLDQFLSERAQPLTDYLSTSPIGLKRKLNRYVRQKIPTRSIARTPQPPITLEPVCLDDLQRDLVLATAVVEQQPQRALEMAEARLAEHPEDHRLLIVQSKALAHLDDQPGALAAAEKALQLAGDDPAVLVNLADRMVHDCLLMQSPDCRAAWRSALPLYRQALALNVDQFDAVFGIGLAYLHGGRAGEAVNYLKVAYGRAPWAIPVNYYLGESYRIIGDTRAWLYLQNTRNWAQNPVWRKLAELALAELADSAG
jgi:tetratricopeptide (TPR) repeat protein